MSRDSIAHAEAIAVQEWQPTRDLCERDTKVRDALCLLVVSEGKTLKRYLDDEVQDDEHDPSLDEVACHDVLILHGTQSVKSRR